MLKKKNYFLLINVSINKSFINKAIHRRGLDFLRISLKNNITTLFNYMEVSTSYVFKKFVFLGIALGLVN